MQPLIRVNSVTKRFGSQTALNAVSLEVPPGVAPLLFPLRCKAAAPFSKNCFCHP